MPTSTTVPVYLWHSSCMNADLSLLLRVLKNTGQAQIFRIQVAQGKGDAAELAKKEATVKSEFDPQEQHSYLAYSPLHLFREHRGG